MEIRLEPEPFQITVEQATEIVKRALVVSDLFDSTVDGVVDKNESTRAGLLFAFLEDQYTKHPKDVEAACTKHIIKVLQGRIDVEIDKELLKQAKAEGKIA